MNKRIIKLTFENSDPATGQSNKKELIISNYPSIVIMIVCCGIYFLLSSLIKNPFIWRAVSLLLN